MYHAIEAGPNGPYHLGDIPGDPTFEEIKTWLAANLWERGAETNPDWLEKQIGIAGGIEITGYGDAEHPDAVEFMSKGWVCFVVRHQG